MSLTSGPGLAAGVGIRQTATVRFSKLTGAIVEADATCHLDTAREITWFEAGGAMLYVLAIWQDLRKPVRNS